MVAASSTRFMGTPRGTRLHHPPDGIAAVGVIEDVVPRANRAEPFRQLALGPADGAVEVGDRVRVANADDEEHALGNLARALALDPGCRARHEGLPRDARRLLVHLLVAAVRHVEVTPRHVLPEGIEPLV